ncbi:MAG: ABC transporter permease [Chloroflexi bacterium]|nr:ABC transporter permease [Chloroflexota bacterium]
MVRQKQLVLFLFWFCLLFTLSACASSPRLALAPTPTAAMPAGVYDGQWHGSGITADGKSIQLIFNVQGSRLSAISYDFIGRDGVPCTNITYNLLPQSTRPQITNQQLSAAPGDDLQLKALFASAVSASGSLAVNWQGRHNCTIQFEVEWKAERTTLPVPAPAQVKVDKWLCGKVNCGEVLLQLLVFGLSNGAVLALNAISVTVVYGAVRTLNLAHGDVFSLTSALVTSILIGLNVKASWPAGILAGVLILTLLAAVGFGVLLNVGLEWAAFRPFRGRSRLAPLIATLGISFILFQLAMIWRTHQGSWIVGEHRSVPGLPEVPTDGIPNFLPVINLVKSLGLPINVILRFNDLSIILLAVGCALGTYFVLRYTVMGRAIQACMENPTLAQMIGIDLNATIRRAFAIGGLLAGVAAFVFAIYYGRPFGQNGAQSGLFAFTAAMLGGIGNPIGALVSALLLGVFSALSDYLVSAEWTPVLLLILLIGLLYFRPEGFFGEGQADDNSTVVLRDALIADEKPGLRKNYGLAWILAALAVFPLFSVLSGLGWQILARGIGIFVLLALGLNILLGVAGVLDLGYAAAFGVGAYCAAILTNPWGLFSTLLAHPPDFLLIFFLSALFAGLFGLLKGLLLSRLRSDYLALATLAMGLLVPRLVVNLKFLTGGAAGISALPAPQIFGVSFANPTAGYYLVFSVLAVVGLASQRLIHSRSGRAWMGSSEDELAASALGVDTAGYRLLALVISSALAGAAGALYASTFAYVDPDILSFHWTAMLLTMVILGGAGSVTGVMLSAMLIIGYDKVFIPRFSTFLALFWPKNFFIGSVPDLRGTSFFNFGIILYLTVLLRARNRKGKQKNEDL